MWATAIFMVSAHHTYQCVLAQVNMYWVPHDKSFKKSIGITQFEQQDEWCCMVRGSEAGFTFFPWACERKEMAGG